MTATPKLSAPPIGTINALEKQCKVIKDLQTCAWIVKLEKHYKKSD